MATEHRSPLIRENYRQFVVDEDSSGFIRRVAQRYTPATLERVVESGSRLDRRAAVLALGYLGDYSSNQVVGRALQDEDRGVRCLAETAIRALWCRDGSPRHQDLLASVLRLNTNQRFDAALEAACALIDEAPWFAEAWNQRAIAHFCLGGFAQSIHDCQQALELNPYHFGAAAGMGQCYLQLGNMHTALESFRRALRLYPQLEGVRANVAYIERALRDKDAQRD